MPAASLSLTTDIKYLKGVGPARAQLFASRGIRTVGDLLYYTPFRYEDRQRITPVRALIPGQTATVLVKILSGGLMRTRTGAYIYDLSAVDASAPAHEPPDKHWAPGMIRLKWFNAVYLEKNKVFRPGQRVFFYGKVDYDRFGSGNLQMVQPQFEILPDGETPNGHSLEVGRVVPIYESVGKMSARVIRRLIWTGLELLDGQIDDPLPPSVRHRNRLLDRSAALRQAHFPQPDVSLEDLANFRTPAQVRLIFEEFFNVTAGLALKRRQATRAHGIAFRVTEEIRRSVKRMLPFHPTAAQKRVIREIVTDMQASRPMARLLQGDVGSGKTIVALQAALVAIGNGYQVAFMAPTEILATQHYLYAKQLFKPLTCRLDLLTSARSSSEKAELKRRLAAGEIDLIFGTHALIESDVAFAQLGLVVVDEQHRFGVMQRYELIRKGQPPDVLIMTATPIPRTLALTLYADLDVSVIDEAPPGRRPIITRIIPEAERAQALEFVRGRVRRGEGAYIVYPLVEEAETLDLRPAVRMYEHLSRNVFPEFRLGLLHGRLRSQEKEAVMESFKRGEVQVLVSTSVVEVGVDVPHATVMLIEHAERFGLAQLHQLRGRVGRGQAQSYCLLVAGDNRTEAAEERLRALAETTDGFRLAETDLKIRGPGEFFGTRQAGMASLRIGNLVRDQDILEWARREAHEFLQRPESDPELQAFVSRLQREWPHRYGLAQVG